MPIRIKCPKCQTILGVKETLAGKKANCPKCRHLLTIPVPKTGAVRAEDVEALALSAFADEPPKVAPVSTKFIEFECPWCAEAVKMSSNRLWGPLKAAEAAAEQPSPKLSKAAVAELHRGIGEFYLMRGEAQSAKEHFGKSRARYTTGQTKQDLEGDTVLIQLML